MDAFIRAVEDARHRLIRQEGSNVSMRELIRRAGYSEAQRPSIAYHLTPSRHDGKKPHRVPPELVRRLAAVLPVSEDELSRAAQVAAGFTVVDPEGGPDLAYVASRFYGDEDVTDQEKAAVTARLLQIIAEHSARGTGSPNVP